MKTNQYYNKIAKQFYNNTINIDMSEFYNSFLPLIPEKSKILDAGCGPGRDTLYFLKKGYQVVSFDSSDEMVKIAKNLTNKDIIVMDFESLNYVDEFDGIWASASLLHVSKQKIKDIIIKILRSLKNNGILYASFKYGDKDLYKNGILYTSYDEITIKELFNLNEGSEIIKIWRTEDLRPERAGEFWLNIIVKRS